MRRSVTTKADLGLPEEIRERLRNGNYRLVAGIDEAGRGPLAGPVVAAAVILPMGLRIPGVDDSKKLSEKRREEIGHEIRRLALDFSIAVVEPETIDEINILEATRLAMKRTIEALSLQPEFALIDGWPVPRFPLPHLGVVRGDATCLPIAAASILAKAERDRLMSDLHQIYPGYGFDRHKGYPTADHLRRLSLHGPCPAHRRSFGPVKKALSL
jgi:ribonuclease HII